MCPDKFPEAFDRFEEDVEVNENVSFKQLVSSFSMWAGYKWRYSRQQMEALANEAIERRINVPAWLGVGFSSKYGRYSNWLNKSRSLSYQNRIVNYMKIHPNASLAEARGHGKR